MPIIDPLNENPLIDLRQSETAMLIRSGLIRGLSESGLVFLPEFALKNSRRCDLIALDPKGKIVIFEIKSSVEDFRVDTKWHEYKTFCDRFYFATSPEVPAGIFPETEGLVIADQYSCEIIRDASETPLKAPTRKALTLRFARASAGRLNRFNLHEGNL